MIRLFTATVLLLALPSLAHAADITGVPVGTVMSRLSRARAMFVAGWKARDATPRLPARHAPAICADG